MTDGYDIAGVLPDGLLEEVAPGTNVAVIGPSMSGKRELALRLLATGYEAGDGILCITTGNAERLFSNLDRHVASLDRKQVGVINCGGGTTRPTIEEMTESVSSPADLTGISIGTAKLFNRFHERGVSDIRYGLISVSSILQHLDSNTVFKFLYVFANRVNDTNGLGIYTLNDDTHDTQIINTVRGQFDGVIELQETGAGNWECRVRGFGRKSTAWTAFE
ncbi:DUF7504 family protein [Natronosalvus halobius]|uniref:DUF7504 family protein n=1 Tax=Natronosalvus halobius TaxID=2953746 RepID=UPI00209CE19B|nr:hypothetical protein [Natronosalvus halobius]USZ71673.1 hypothetical protein NGM15_16680 [Natronosalvus halobius]